MDLRELLSIPYLLEAEAVETEPGKWLLHCHIKELERRRIEMIVSLVEAGKQPPVPRQPLAASDPLWTANDLGLSARVAALLGSPTR